MKKKKIIDFLKYLMNEFHLAGMYKEEYKITRFKELITEIEEKIAEINSPNKYYRKIISYGLGVIETKGSPGQLLKYEKQILEEKERKKK